MIDPEAAASSLIAATRERSLGRKFDRWRRRIDHAVNSGRAPDSANCRKTYLHLLTDYQNENAILARRQMSVREAGWLNARLRGTGFGWNRQTGY